MKSFKPSIQWLIVFLPVAIAFEIAHVKFHAAWASPSLIFLFACLAIIPAAGWMGHATEAIAARVGQGLGGFLNATFGNAAELLIAGMALFEASKSPERAEAMHTIVKASLTGGIMGNLLLVLGAAVLAGGVKFQLQKFNAQAARASATLLTLSIVAMLVPSLFSYLASPKNPKVQDISLEIALILIIVYVLSLFFSLRTHKHLYAGEEEEGEAHGHGAGDGKAVVKKAILKLVGATVIVGILAELMIGSVEEASKAIGLSDLFVGVVVLAIVGNAAEHSTAVLVAMRNKMDLSVGIAIGSSVQLALFVAPVLVLLSYLFGTPMNLVFTAAELVALGISVFITGQIAEDGESHWLEGVMLLTVYIMMGVLFYYLPS